MARLKRHLRGAAAAVYGTAACGRQAELLTDYEERVTCERCRRLLGPWRELDERNKLQEVS